MRIAAPTFTQTPNDLFDHWLPKLSESELKVILIILRKTFGWHKTRDYISISMLAKKTGLLEETVIKAAKSLQKKGLILKEVIGTNGKQQTYYELIVEENSNNLYPSVQPRGPLGLDPGVSTEAQNKSSYIKEKQQQKKVAKSPVVVPSSDEEKREEDADEAATQYINSEIKKGNRVNETRIRKLALNEGWKPNNEGRSRQLVKAFQNKKTYTGANGMRFECYNSENRISFLNLNYPSHQPLGLDLKSPNFKEDFEKLLQKLDLMWVIENREK